LSKLTLPVDRVAELSRAHAHGGEPPPKALEARIALASLDTAHVVLDPSIRSSKAEDIRIADLGPVRPVEAFDEGVLRGLAGLDVAEVNAAGLAPGGEGECLAARSIRQRRRQAPSGSPVWRPLT
jgi:hypothetical protein